MLAQVRNALKGVVMWFFAVLLILAFALWGVPELRQFSSSAAITVGKEQFSSNYVQSEFNRAIQVRRQETGKSFTQEDAIASGLPDQIINTIATRSAISQYTNKLGLATPRDVIRDYLQKNENFQNPATGKFDKFTLQAILQQNNMTVDEFEKRIGDQLMAEQLINALTASGPAPTPLIDAMLLRETERRRIAYLLVTNEMSGAPAEPMPNDLEEYYNENPVIFTAPEYRTFDLLVLKPEQFSGDVSVPEEEIRRLYDANKERLYDQPEKRTLYQITYDTQAEAEAAVAALRQGQPFEKLASDKNLSLDAVTFTDALKRNILDPSVADAAFAEGLKEGAILDPVRSLFGWTVVQIAGIKPPESKSFEEVRAEIEADYVKNDTRRELLNAIDKIEEERDTGATLAAAAEAAGLEVKTIGPIDQYSFEPGGAIVNDVPGEALAEAFRLQEDEQSEALQLADNKGYFFVAVREITPPALKPFDDVRDDVEARWRQHEQEQRISATVRSIRKSVEGGETLEKVASTFDRSPIELEIDRRFENDAISADFTNQLFFADLGEMVSGPTAFGKAQIVAQIRDIIVTPNAITPDQVALYSQYLGYQLDNELLEDFVGEIRKDYGVKTSSVQLDALFGDNR